MAESICRFASFELSQQWYGPTESKHTILGPKEAIVDNRSRRILQIELKNAEFKSFRRERERESHSGDANVHSITTPLVISYSNACLSEF